MSDKIFLKDITLPIVETGEDETYSFVQTDSDLETEGDAADAKKTGDEISELKADLTAIETDIESGNRTAGTAKQLLADTGMTDKSPYLFRAMPTGAGDREEPVIVGGSVVWNQLLTNNFFTGATPSKATVSVEEGITTLTGTQASIAQSVYKSAAFLQTNHVYACAVKAKADTTGVRFGISLSQTSLSENNVIKITDLTTSWTTYYGVGKYKQGETPYLRVGTSSTSSLAVDEALYLTDLVFIDLTAMFGSTIADYVYTLESATNGAGIAWLKKYGFFTEDYYPYTEPTFKHVEGLTAHKMVGFNQWDEEWELGSIYANSGIKYATTDSIRSKNYIPALPSTTYYFKASDSTRHGVFYYDADKQFVGVGVAYTKNVTFTTPPNCHYLLFDMAQSYGTTYKNDICINLSDPAKNGTYEPYKSYTYPLDTDVVLRGIPKLDANNDLYFDGDVYKPDGTVTRRYGVVDLGTLNWGLQTVYNLFYVQIPGVKETETQTTLPNARCTKYPTVTQDITSSIANDKIITIGRTGFFANSVCVRDTSYTDAASFKTAMSGVYLVYELATPTTETADPYAPLQLADPYGTEEWVLADEAFPMPVGQETFYPENLRAKIEGLPWNFANLIAPTEASNVATRAYTAGQLFIVDNILYKAATSIASGGTITPGTNCTATTLAEIISALQ